MDGLVWLLGEGAVQGSAAAVRWGGVANSEENI